MTTKVSVAPFQGNEKKHLTWTPDEEKKLLEAVNECGTDWSKIHAKYHCFRGRNQASLSQKY